jgi:hypothetical protein
MHSKNLTAIIFPAEGTDIQNIQLIPTAALEFMLAIENDTEVSCVNCKKCGYPHLDLADFAAKPHRKHYCGNCGYDHTQSNGPIISTPLKPFYDKYTVNKKLISPNREINIDDYQNSTFDIWASTPAIIWTANRPQEKGLHVHIYDEKNKRVVDDTFPKVILEGKELSRKDVLKAMIGNTKTFQN